MLTYLLVDEDRGFADHDCSCCIWVEGAFDSVFDINERARLAVSIYSRIAQLIEFVMPVN